MFESVVAILNSLPQSTASLLGTLLGSSLSVFAVIGGAMFNAHLNRKRDDRIRDADRQALEGALLAELRIEQRAFVENAKAARADELLKDKNLLIPESTSRSIFKVSIDKLNLLKPVDLQLVLDAFLTIETHTDSLMLLADGETKTASGGRTYILLPGAEAENYAIMCDSVGEKINDAIAALDRP